MEVLRLLATPSLDRTLYCSKLAMRFVSDDPPPALVDRMAETFRKKDGKIREVLKTMFQLPEFWSDDAYRAKVKTPLEFVVSAVRATAAEVTDALPLARQLNTLGMPLYGMQPPTGYSMKSDAWVNSSALLGRMNFSMALVSGRIKRSRARTQIADRRTTAAADSERTLAILERVPCWPEMFPANPRRGSRSSWRTRSRLRAKRTSRRRPPMCMIAGLILGSPEFRGGSRERRPSAASQSVVLRR